MYPLKFKSVYKEKIWGGTALAEKFDRDIPSNSIGESWEIAARENGSSKISNGRFAGKELMEVIEKEGTKVLGTKAKDEYFQKFPLLIKLLDANDKLSVQVHPDDEYAFEHEDGELGKTEMWYVIDAQEDAKLIYGVNPEVTKEEFATAIKEGNLEEKLIKVNVEAGDVLYIPAGTIHAIEEGILLAEIQRNSDTTYRVYDWNRVGQDGEFRELHIESALDVIDFEAKPQTKVTGLEIEEKGVTRNILVACPYFITETLDINKQYADQADGSRFYILMGLEGKARLTYQDGEIDLEAGETVLLPAVLGDYIIKGDCKLIKSYIKDPTKLKTELSDKGYSKTEINRIKGII
ncbi:type I phosphomannose isomerase catalytic subunit [Sporohalobacter salinus]|uniref:type I phosphomannose isomerase catalytic subunit n=1 Tax=Sporohalobacter salinus TaxID=1494606 RepID=UPI00195FD76F|nr:type I phosphomannose isomerase catalytic subunit [Sporohalobacter salinus]MBM7622517.1 mannose-6-phosphate isomerase [Sporohalobacter salinus]